MARLVDYTAQADVVDLVQRSRDTTLACPVYRHGTLVAPTEAGSTVTVYDAAGDVVVDAEAVDVVDGVATYLLLGTVTAALELGRGWRIEWSLVLPDGTHTFRLEAGLVRCTPSPVITDQAIWSRCPSLSPRSPGQPLTRATTYQTAIDDAWIRLRNRLDALDHRVELVVNSTQLREPHLLLTLAAIFGDLAARNAAHQAQADAYLREYEAVFARTTLALDTDDDGDADEARPARPPMFLM